MQGVVYGEPPFYKPAVLRSSPTHGERVEGDIDTPNGIVRAVRVMVHHPIERSKHKMGGSKYKMGSKCKMQGKDMYTPDLEWLFLQVLLLNPKCEPF